ncbi:MAG: TatD family hydrolase, partial [Bacilli bacterium]|nr:TatD family hydrolase [Bacilli bacterium]
IAQIELANKYNLPIDIHCREAYEDLLNILKNHKVNKKGIIHCYSSSLEMSRLFIVEGYILGIGGVVTFKNALKLKEVAKHVPSNAYVLETDAPYLTPTPHRGEVNHSKYLNFIAQEIANLKGVDVSEVINETASNFKRLFSL